MTSAVCEFINFDIGFVILVNNMCVRIFIAAAVALSFFFPAAQAAEADAKASNLWSVGLIASTLGGGAQASFLVANRVVIRLEGTYASIDNVPEQKSNFSVLSGGAILDLHPFKGAFRVSGGVRYFDFNYDLTKDQTSYFYTQNGFYTTSKDSFKVSVTNKNKIAPYGGFGFDAAHFSGSGLDFNIGVDLGVIYGGDPTVKISSATLGIDAKAEQSRYFDRYQFLNFYPVATVSARVSF